MLILGFLALSVGLIPLAILFALGRLWTLEAYRTIRFCDACLALKMGVLPRDVREAVALVGDGFQISSGKCSECLQEKTVVRALAA